MGPLSHPPWDPSLNPPWDPSLILQAVLAAQLATRRFTSDGHITWIRSLIDVVDQEATGSLAASSLPTLFAAANITPSYLPPRATRVAISRGHRQKQSESIRCCAGAGGFCSTAAPWSWADKPSTRLHGGAAAHG